MGITMQGQHLEEYRWENRILLVKTKNEWSEKYRDQLEVFRGATEALKERKIILYQIVGSQYDLIDYTNKRHKESGALSNEMTDHLLNHKNQFEIILIGLDGGIKYRKTELLTMEDLFSIIDSMPMRRAEMRKKKGVQ